MKEEERNSEVREGRGREPQLGLRMATALAATMDNGSLVLDSAFLANGGVDDMAETLQNGGGGVSDDAGVVADEGGGDKGHVAEEKKAKEAERRRRRRSKKKKGGKKESAPTADRSEDGENADEVICFFVYLVCVGNNVLADVWFLCRCSCSGTTDEGRYVFVCLFVCFLSH